jgi:hypothetical protein
MSSVTRFIRQIPQSNTYYSAAVVAATPATYCYQFVPSANNVVGNYPPGYMNAANAALQGSIAGAVAAAGAGGAANLILRDMGKTIQAPISSLTGSVGFFRQVQLLSPSALTAAQGYNGGLNGNTFGVSGINYLTFYVPTVVLGIAGVAAATAQDLVRAGGSM